MRGFLIRSSLAVGFLACGLSTQLVAAVPVPAPTSNSLPSLLRDVGIDQKLNNQVPLDLLFRDETGKEVRLGQYFGQKPVVLVLAYYDCPMLCTIVLNGVLHNLKELKYNVGQQFEVVTVSFDPTEKPSLAAAKKAISSRGQHILLRSATRNDHRSWSGIGFCGHFINLRFCRLLDMPGG